MIYVLEYQGFVVTQVLHIYFISFHQTKWDLRIDVKKQSMLHYFKVHQRFWAHQSGSFYHSIVPSWASKDPCFC